LPPRDRDHRPSCAPRRVPSAPAAAQPTQHAASTEDWCELTLTDRCNQRCFFCYEDGRHVGRDPDLASVKQLLARTAERADTVVLCGKEVLLRPDVLDIVAHAVSIGLRVVVFSNAQALARDGMVERLVEAGCTSLAVSFHFPDAATFARGTRTAEKGFARALAGLRRVADFRRAHPGVRLGLSTETDMSALNDGRLVEMRATLIAALGEWPWQMRLAHLLPAKAHDIGLTHALAPLAERRLELAQFVATQPPWLELTFVKTPLCLVPSTWRHRTLELRYILEDTALTLNHLDPAIVSTDPFTPSAQRDLRAAMQKHPYRWLCRACALAPLCRFDIVTWHHRFFEPTPAHEPIAQAAPALAELLARSPHDEAAAVRVATLARSLGPPFPEEALLAALREQAALHVRSAHVERDPILTLTLECSGTPITLHLRPASKRGEGATLGALVDMLEVDFVGPTETAPLAPSLDVRRAALAALAAVRPPEAESWSGVRGFDLATARAWRGAWLRLGDLLWPGLGVAGNFRTVALRPTHGPGLDIELAGPNQGRAFLCWRATDESLVLVADCRAQRDAHRHDYEELHAALEARGAGLSIELRVIDRESKRRARPR